MVKAGGFSLIEVLISLFLSTLLLTSLYYLIFAAIKQYHSLEEALNTAFEWQWVSASLTNSVRQAGFTPCLPLDALTIIDRRNKHGPSVQSLQVERPPVEGFSIRRMSASFGLVAARKGSRSLQVITPFVLQKKHPVLIADCHHAEIHQLASLRKYPRGYFLQLQKPLLHEYAADSSLGEWIEEKWFIQKNKQGVPALYYQRARKEEVTDSIHALRAKIMIHDNRALLHLSVSLERQTKILDLALRGAA